MKLNKTKITLVGLLVLLLVFGATGCRLAPRPEPAPSPTPAPAPEVPAPQTPDMQPVPPTNNVPQDPNINTPGTVPAPGAVPAPRQQMGPNNRANANQVAERIASMVSDMDDVDRATAVVMGNMALVGVRMEGGNAEANRAQNRDNAAHQEMKREISARVEREMSEINEVIVTTDPEVTKRIENMSKNIADGRPISESFDELAEIVRRINPATN